MTDSNDTAPTLTFGDLRLANSLRLPLFRNALGKRAHSRADGSDWSLNDWCLAVLGELGEAANLLKKVRRGDMDLAAARPALADEFADVAIYLDLLAMQAGIDLGVAVVDKFNRKSQQVGAAIFIEPTPDGLRVVARRPGEATVQPTPPAFSPEPQANIFWIADDPERSHDSVNDAMVEAWAEPWEIVCLQRALRMSDIFAVRVPIAGADGELDDDEIREFPTRAEAEAFVEVLRSAEAQAQPTEGGE